MNRKSAILNSIIALIVIFPLLVHAAPPDEGKVIFTARCASCHNVNKRMTGPALAGVDQRRSIDWIIRFVHSSKTVIASGDTAAVGLFEKFNRVAMPEHPDLTEAQIKSIVDYIKVEAKNGVTAAPFEKPTRKPDGYLPLSIHDYPFFGVYLFAVACLVGVLLFCVYLVRLREAQKAAGGK